MTRKRKSEATPRLDEADRTIYSTFCGAANSLSQLYTQAMNHQKTTFQAGERHAYVEKLYHWILRQHEEGSRVSVADVLSHIQKEMDNGGEDATSPRISFQPQHPQPTIHPANFVSQSSYGVFGQATVSHGHRSGNSADQSKNSVFSNALSSPIRRSLQPFHLAQGGNYYANVPPPGNSVGWNQDPNQSRGSNSPGSNDGSMDMHSDSPPHGSY